MGVKTSDVESFPLCHEGSPNRCHQRFDQGVMFTKAQRREIEPIYANLTRAHLRALAANDAGVRRVVEKVIGL